MSNVDAKKNENKMVAPSRASSDLTEHEQRQAAIQAMAGKGFAANVKGATEVEEPNVVDDKHMLIDVPFLILDIQVKPGKYGEKEFAILTCQLENDEVVIVTDGSTGILEQVRGRDGDCPIFVPGGLRVSAYKNEFGDCETFYLSGRTPKQKKALSLRAGTNGAQRALHNQVA